MKKYENITDVWRQYQQGIDYKQRINLYSTVDENYRYFQGEQWYGVKDDGLPLPVFNIIKPVGRYKVSTIMQNDTQIVYKCDNNQSPNYLRLQEIASNLTKYASTRWEKLKMDFNNEIVLQEAFVAGCGYSFHYYDTETKETKMDLIDITNVYPQNPNEPNIQSQESIIISYRMSVKRAKAEAKKNGVKDWDNITSDNDTSEQAGDNSKIEVDNNDMCIVLLKMWKDDDGYVHFIKSAKTVIIQDDTNTRYKYYPLAMMIWENNKNCFYGVSDVTGLIPNQDYINTIASMIMMSTTFTSFPKMVYNDDLIQNPSNQIGVAIPFTGGENKSINQIIDYISPQGVSNDVFNMFDKTITLTKDLMGANDGALGNINPENASGKAIIAVMEQSATPLESIRRRFYNYIEDIALIWADMWRVHSADGKIINFVDDNGNEQSDYISSLEFDELMLSVKIDVGANMRYSQRATEETLTNLLQGKYIPFEWFVKLLPDGSTLPKEKIMQMLDEQKQIEQQQQMQEQMLQEQQMQQIPQMTDDDIDQMLAEMPEEQKQQALQNPQILKDIISQRLGGAMGGTMQV